MTRLTLARVWIATVLIAQMVVLTSAQETPTYRVLKTDQPVEIDGRLDEAVWKQVPSVGPFRINQNGEPSNLPTEAWIVYDDEFIYFAFRLEDENIWATYRQRDQHLWTQEVVEVFIHPNPEHPAYIELEVNPLGTMLDIFLLDIRKPLPYESWNSKHLKWAVQVDGTVDGTANDRGWTCEIALPFEDVAMAPNVPPAPGDRWRVNLYRVENRPEKVGLAWSPTLRPDFHVPSMFGTIEFSEQPASESEQSE